MDRIIFDNNGTLKDLSVKLRRFSRDVEVVGIVGADDALYLGSHLPFNHRYFYFSNPNDQACTLDKIELWDSKEWTEAVDIIDETSDGTNTFAQNGRISWVLNKDEGWHREDTSNGSYEVTGLGTLKIYDLFWAKFTFSGTMNAATAIKYVGYKFAEDDDLGVEYPELVTSNVMGAFESGKTDWDEQHFLAGEKLINTLKEKNIIVSKNQLLFSYIFKEAAVHKLAEIIYNAFGDDSRDNAKKARDDFYLALKFKTFFVDQDSDARLDPRETISTTGYMKR